MPKASLPTKTSPKGSPSVDNSNELAKLKAKVKELEKQSGSKALPCFVTSFIVEEDGSYIMTGSFAGTEVYGDPFKKGNGQFLCDPDQRSNKQGGSQYVQSRGFALLIRPALLDSN